MRHSKMLDCYECDLTSFKKIFLFIFILYKRIIRIYSLLFFKFYYSLRLYSKIESIGI